MAFGPTEVDELLARTGRMCAICNHPHGVQVHHIVPKSADGSDEIGNAIPLCPNCHNEVHTAYGPGRITRLYSENELRLHLARTIELAARQATLRPGSEDWLADAELMRFFAQCLDRPAFRRWFHQELSFTDFDKALEDTSLALNTGYWRTRDGAVIGRSVGKAKLTNPDWRLRLDQIVDRVDEARRLLRDALNLDSMLFQRRSRLYDDFDLELRGDALLGQQLDELRQSAIDDINFVLSEIGDPPLGPLR